MNKLLMQTDSLGFFIEPTYNAWEGAIDTIEPVFDKDLERAKWNGTDWEIKTIVQWQEEENLKLEEQRKESEEQIAVQKEIDEAKKITNTYELLVSLGVKFEWN